MPRSLSIRSQLLALMLAVALPAGGLITYGVIDAAREARESAYGYVRSLALETANRLELIIRDNEALLARLAERPRVKALDPSNCDLIISEFVFLYPEYTTLGIRDRDANSVCSFIHRPPDGSRVREFPWFIEGLRSEKFTVGDAFLGRAAGLWVSVLTYPVRDASGKVSGLLALPLDLLALQKRIVQAIPESAIVLVLDREDKFLMRSIDPAKWIGKPLPGPQADLVRGKRDGFFSATGVDGIRRLYAVVSIPSSGWRVFAGLPEDQVFAAHRERLTRSIGIGIAILLLALALAYRTSSAIARPIGELAQTAVDIARGGSPAHAPIKGASEIETVANQLDRLVDERERRREERAALTAHCEQLIKLARDIVLLIDPSGHIVEVNDAAVAAYGYSADELRGMHVRDLRVPEARAATERDWQASSRPEGALFETTHRRMDGSTFPVEISSRPIEIEGRHYVQGFVRDITERKRAEAALLRQKDLYNMLAHTNQAIVLCTSREGLFSTVCRIAVEHGRFRFAWIGMIGLGDAQIQPVAQHGEDAGYVEELRVSASPATAIGQGPTGKALQTGVRVLSNDFLKDPATAPWHEAARRAGVRASAAFPIRENDAVIGSFNLYAGEPDFFTGELLHTLDEITTDVSLALDNFALRAVRKQIEEALQKSDALLNQTQEITKVGGWECEVATGSITWTDETYRIHEVARDYDPNDLQQNIEFYAAEERIRIAEAFRRAVEQGEPYDLELPFVTAKGRRRWVRTVGRAERKDGKVIRVFGNIMDITERKQAEALLAGEKRSLEAITSGTPLAAILETIARTVETISSGVLCSILLLDADGVHVRHGAAPSLPDDYNRAIDGQAIGPNAGSCGTAAYRNQQVIVTDIATDPLWTDYRALALQHGLRACWSTPIRSVDGRVLGTFALYYREQRTPIPADLELIERLTHLTSIAIERKRAEEKNAQQHAELQRWFNATLGREDRVGQLKHEVNELRGRLGEVPRYANPKSGDSE